MPATTTAKTAAVSKAKNARVRAFRRAVEAERPLFEEVRASNPNLSESDLSLVFWEAGGDPCVFPRLYRELQGS